MKRKSWLLLLALGISLPALAQDSDPSEQTIFRNLGITAESVKVESSEEIAEGFYTAQVSFTILPSNSCMDRYAGVAEGGSANHYKVVYATTWNARCKMFARPRTVKHVFTFDFRTKKSADLTLNGKHYEASHEGKTVSLKLK